MPSLGEIAADLGVACFPCDNSKRPIIAGGFKSATSDRDSIIEAFNHPNAALIGMPTGRLSGLVAIDIDIKGATSGTAWLDQNCSVLPQTRTHKTRSGGLHLIFQCPSVEIRNSAGRIAPGVDVRGDGGYIILPPSPGYVIADPTPPAEMPRWLIEACQRPDPPQPQSHSPRGRMTDGGTRYGLAALQNECSAVRTASWGQQETTVNAAGLKIGALVAGGELNRGLALAELLAAARAMPSQPGREPWNPGRLEEHVKRAFEDGKDRPRTAPNPENIRPTTSGFSKPNRSGATNSSPEELKELDDRNILPLEFFDAIRPTLDVHDFVEGLLIERSSVVVYGESNCGKTFWVADLALHVAAGLPWNGKEVVQGGVVYLILEGTGGFRNRVSAWRQERADDRLVRFAAIPHSVNLLDPDADVDRVIAALHRAAETFEMPVKLAIVDTLSRALAGGNENASEDMGALVANMDRIRQETGAAVLFVHHCGKDAARGARGHSSLRAAIDTEIEITAIPGLPVRTATVVKQRELETVGEFQFRLSPVDLGTNARGKPVTSCVVETGDILPPPAGTKWSIPKGQPMLAFRILCDLIAQCGEPGYGIPNGCLSVPDDWWRERFYDRALPGADRKAREKAFRRAADALTERNVVGCLKGRVWLC